MIADGDATYIEWTNKELKKIKLVKYFGQNSKYFTQ